MIAPIVKDLQERVTRREIGLAFDGDVQRGPRRPPRTPAPCSETDLLRALILRAPFAITRLWRVERRNIINVESKHGARVRNGVKGQADAFALFHGGLHVELETKAARGVMAEAQKRWAIACAANGVPHMVLRARRGEDAEVTVLRWIEELREEGARHE